MHGEYGLVSFLEMYKTEQFLRLLVGNSRFGISSGNPLSVATRWDEKAGLRRDAIRSKLSTLPLKYLNPSCALEYVEKGEGEGKTLQDAMRVGGQDGMQHFDGEIGRLIREGILDLDTGLAYATNPGNLQLELAGLAALQADPLLETSMT